MSQQFRMPNEEIANLTCCFVKCKRNVRYTIVYDYVYDGDGQIVLYATWVHTCDKHKKIYIKVLKKARKKHQIIDLLAEIEKVKFN